MWWKGLKEEEIMTKIYIVRHGQTEWNIQGKIQGHANAPLTEKGLGQGELVANRLKDEVIDVIYASDLDRARITAEKISKSTGAKLIITEELREMSFGIWEGMLFTEVKEKYPEDFLKWLSKPEDLKIENGETLFTLENRMERVINDIMSKHEGENICIVSHGTALKTLILHLLKMPLTNYKNLAMDNVSISIVEKRDYNNVLKIYNDTNHLGE